MWHSFVFEICILTSAQVAPQFAHHPMVVGDRATAKHALEEVVRLAKEGDGIVRVKYLPCTDRCVY